MPSICKEGNVVPAFKKNDTSEKLKHHPLTFNAFVGALFESLVAKTMHNHLGKHDLINGSHHCLIND